MLGPGANQLPMVHVADMAAVVAKVVDGPAESGFRVVVDQGLCTLGEAAAAVAGVLGTGKVENILAEAGMLLPAESGTLLPSAVADLAAERGSGQREMLLHPFFDVYCYYHYLHHNLQPHLLKISLKIHVVQHSYHPLIFV